VQSGLQVDDSGLGASPLAERIRALAPIGGDDRRSALLLQWFHETCEITSAASAMQCATTAGMTCVTSDETSVRCGYEGTLRSRPVRFIVSPSAALDNHSWGELRIDMVVTDAIGQ